MVKHHLFRAAFMTVTAAVIIALPLSCVNEEYDLSRIDTTVSFGGDALVFPLGSTEDLTLKTLLSEEDFQYITSLDGVYGFTINGEYKVPEEDIPDLSAELQIDPVSFNHVFNIDFGTIDMSGMRLDEQNFSNDINFTGIEIPDVTIPQDALNSTVATGIWEYAPSADALDLDFPSSQSIEAGGLLDPSRFSSLPSTGRDITIPAGTISDLTLPERSFNVDISINFHEGVKAIRDIKLDENASLDISVDVLNSFMKSGSISPDIDIDLGSLVGIEGGTSVLKIDGLLSTENDYSLEKHCKVTSLSISEEDWSTDTDGNLLLSKHASVTVSGSLSFVDDIVTGTDLIQSSANAGGLGLRVEFRFNDIVIADMTMEIEPVTLTEETSVDLGIDPVTLPEEVRGISEVLMETGSGLGIEISGANMEYAGGLEPVLESLVIQFPEEVVSPNLEADNTYKISSIQLSQGLNDNIVVTSIRPGEAVDGTVSIDGSVRIKAVFKAEGSISLSSLPKDESQDPAISFNVVPNLTIDDYILVINDIEHEIEPQEHEVNFSLPDGVGEIGVFTVTPEAGENAQLSIAIGMPQTDGIKFQARDIKIDFPDMFQFEDSGQYNFNSEDNSITLNGDIPDNVVLKIKSLRITPLRNDAGGYSAGGVITVSGRADVGSLNADGTVTGTDVQNLLDNGISIRGTMSAIENVTVSFDSFETTVENTQPITLFNFDDLPAELVSLEEVTLSDTRLQLSMNVTDIPVVLAGNPLNIELEVHLPQEIVIDDERVDGDNVLHISGVLGDDNTFTMDPVVVSGLDLAGVDFAAGEGDFVREIRAEGKVVMENPSFNPEDLSGKGVNVALSGGIPKINIVQATGKVDYRMDALNQTISLEDLPDFVKGEDFVLDFENPYITLDVTSNMGIPVNGTIEIIPSTGGTPDEQSSLTIEGFEIPAATSSAEAQTTSYWISATTDGVPSGYRHLTADLSPLLKKIPDNIEIRVNAGTDPEQLSVIETTAKYELGMSYDVVVPFEFGEDLDISMDYTIEDIPDVLGELLGMNSLGLGGYIESTLPLKLDLEMEMLDSKDNVIKTEPVKMTVAEGSAEKVSESPVDVWLKLAEGADASDFSKIRMNFKVTSGSMSGEPVTEESYIKAVLKVKVPGGVTVDLSSLGQSENTDEPQN